MARRNCPRETVCGEPYDPAKDPDPMPEIRIRDREILDRLVIKAQKVGFLKAMDEKRLKAALARMELIEYAPGELVFKQGRPGKGLYIVDRGTLTAYKKPVEGYDDDGNPIIPRGEGWGDMVERYDATDKPCFGEVALLYAEPCQVTVQADFCDPPAECYFIDRLTYTRVVVKMAYNRRTRHMQFLNKCHLLDTVQSREKARLCDAFRLRKFKKGDTITRAGDEADGMYWIEKGQVRIAGREDGGPTPATPLVEGDFFGELGLLLSKKRTKTYIADSDCELAFLSADAFERLHGKLRNMLLRAPALYKDICKEYLDTDNPSLRHFR